MNCSSGCYGAATILDYDSEICRKCQSFGDCSDECLKTLEAFKGEVDVSDLTERHVAERKRLGLPNPKGTQAFICRGGANAFARDSDRCRACQKYQACAAESLSSLGKNHGEDVISNLLKRHAAVRAIVESIPVAITSVEPHIPHRLELVTPSDTMSKNEEAENSGMTTASKTPEAEHDMIEAEADKTDELINAALLSDDDDDDDDFATIFRNLTEAPECSLLEGLRVTLAPTQAEADLPHTGADASTTQVEVADDTALQHLNTIKANDSPLPPRFRNTGGSGKFNPSGTYSPEDTNAL